MKGSSGSGKTTLLKLIMKFYEPKKGSIKIGNTDLKSLKSYVLDFCNCFFKVNLKN